MHRFLISAAHKSSGKTTVSVGIAAAARARGLAVRPFKKGPDYIDPLWLARAAGHECRNLDFFLSGPDELRAQFARHACGADLCLVEGNKGLYDGLDLEGSNSNAALARLLDLPVLLVLDARGMTRGVAPLILGYQAFDPAIRIAGVILNRLGGSRHESKLRAVIEHYTDAEVLGAVHEDEAIAIPERHLGLMPANEAGAADKANVAWGDGSGSYAGRAASIGRATVRVQAGTAIGSGVVIDLNGWALTSAKLVAGATHVNLLLGRISLPAAVVKRDEKIDVALLRFVRNDFAAVRIAPDVLKSGDRLQIVT
ncbi:MAG: hypothetical protein COZ38_02745, partial [Rhodocyclales bacterium CG_4_10_14_3_um_filter_68_10]